jgi:hypothetical protein
MHLPLTRTNLPGRERLLLVAQLAKSSVELSHPLGSTPITEVSTLLLDDPSSPCASLLSPFAGQAYKVFACHRTKISQVQHSSLNQIHATYTPDTAWPINRHSPRSSRRSLTSPVLMPTIPFDASSMVHLRSSLCFVLDGFDPTFSP